MYINRHTIFIFKIFLFSLLITGCQNSNIKKVVPFHTESGWSGKTDTVYLDTSKLKKVDVALTGLGYDGDLIAQSMQSSNYSTPPGGDPTASLVGTLVGGELIKSMQLSAAIEEKNKRVETFLNKVAEIDWEGIVQSNTQLKKDWFVNVSESASISTLQIQPELRLSADYRHFELISLVTIKSETTHPIYQNYFHIYAEPLLDKTMLLSELNNLSEERISKDIKQLLVQLEYLVDKELSDWQKVSRQNNPIKFKSDEKQYYERGTILAKDEKNITYRTLRGEIKHIPYQN